MCDDWSEVKAMLSLSKECCGDVRAVIVVMSDNRWSLKSSYPTSTRPSFDARVTIGKICIQTYSNNNTSKTATQCVNSLSASSH